MTTTFEILLLMVVFTFLFLLLLDISFFFRRKRNREEIFKDPYKVRLYKIFAYFILPITNIAGLFFCANGFFVMFYNNAHTVDQYPLNNEVWDDFKKPLMITFDRPIQIDRLKYTLIPELEGELKVEKVLGILPLYRKLYFFPKSNMYGDQTLYFYMVNIRSILADKDRWDFETYAQLKPLALQTSTAHYNPLGISLMQDIRYEFDQELNNYYDFRFESTPGIKSSQRREGKTLIIHPEEPLSTATVYNTSLFLIPKIVNLQTLEEFLKLEEQKITEVSFTTVDAANIKEFLPGEKNVLPSDMLTINFTQEMDKESVEKNMTITPTIDFTTTWLNSSSLQIKPNNALPYSTKYTIHFNKGIKSLIGSMITEEVSLKFSTIGEVDIEKSTPSNNATNVSLSTQIKISFNQEVDHASAESNFQISPNVNGKFNWDETNLIFTPSSKLTENTSYKVTLKSNIKSVRGLDSKSNIEVNFKTSTNKILLSVPLRKQTNRFDCNLTATKMVLEYRGINLSVDQIYSEIDKDNTACTQIADNQCSVWGDPNVGYVGSRSTTPGYGVYWDPVAKLINKKGRNTKTYRNMTIEQLTNEIQNGNPAIIWWQNQTSTPTNKSWKTPSGKDIYAINGMHSEVAIGFIGPSSNPTSIILNDPRGSQRTVSVSYFKSYWGYFSNTAVVIY